MPADPIGEYKGDELIIVDICWSYYETEKNEKMMKKSVKEMKYIIQYNDPDNLRVYMAILLCEVRPKGERQHSIYREKKK